MFILFSLLNGFNHNIRQIAYKWLPTEPNEKRYMIDIDGTICNTYQSNYDDSKPIYKHIRAFNAVV